MRKFLLLTVLGSVYHSLQLEHSHLIGDLVRLTGLVAGTLPTLCEAITQRHLDLSDYDWEWLGGHTRYRDHETTTPDGRQLWINTMRLWDNGDGTAGFSRLPHHDCDYAALVPLEHHHVSATTTPAGGWVIDAVPVGVYLVPRAEVVAHSTRRGKARCDIAWATIYPYYCAPGQPVVLP